MIHRKIWESGSHRIVEKRDLSYKLEDLKGDVFKPNVNPEQNPVELKVEEVQFEHDVEALGVYGYELERWEAAVDQGWTHVDSCWGFVGGYNEFNERFNHYIIYEMISTARAEREAKERMERAE